MSGLAQHGCLNGRSEAADRYCKNQEEVDCRGRPGAGLQALMLACCRCCAQQKRRRRQLCAAKEIALPDLHPLQPHVVRKLGLAEMASLAVSSVVVTLLVLDV